MAKCRGPTPIVCGGDGAKMATEGNTNEGMPNVANVPRNDIFAP